MSQDPIFRDNILPTKDAANILGVNQERIRYWIKHYPNVGLRIGGRYYIYKYAIQQIMSGIPLVEIVAPSSRSNNRSDDDEQSGTSVYYPLR